MTENYVLPVSSCPVNASTPSKVYESTSTMLPTQLLDPLSDLRRLRLARFDAYSSRPDRTPRKIHLMTTRCNDPGTNMARKARMTLLMNGRTAVSLVLIKLRRSAVLYLGCPGRQTDLKKINSYHSHLQYRTCNNYHYVFLQSFPLHRLQLPPMHHYTSLLHCFPSSNTTVVYKGYIANYYSSHSLQIPYMYFSLDSSLHLGLCSLF